MTMQDLRQYSSMRAEIQRLSSRLEALRLELAEEKDEATTKAISALYVQVEALHRRQLIKEHEITKRIEQIDDAQVRTSIQLHYIDGYTWNEVADIIGGNNTEDSVKKRVSRYLKSCPICHGKT